MRAIPRRLDVELDRELGERRYDEPRCSAFKMWSRYYLDFCLRYGHPVRSPIDSLPLFFGKIASKGQGEAARMEAAEAVHLFVEVLERFPEPGLPKEAGDQSLGAKGGFPEADGDSVADSLAVEDGRTLRPELSVGGGVSWGPVYDKLENVLAVGQYALTTRRTYRGWVRQFQAFLKSSRPEDVGSSEAAGFLTHLAREREVGASTQNQAFNALLFLFKNVWEKEFNPEGVTRAKKTRYIPTTLSRAEVDEVIGRLPHPYALLARLMYGCGLRLAEALELRVQDFDFVLGVLTVRRGKGQKDRTVPLAEVMEDDLRGHLEQVRERFEKDMASPEFGGAFMPKRGSKRKWDTRAKDWGWQYFFPASRLTVANEFMEKRRYHLHGTRFSALLRDAAKGSGISRRVTSHAFRHSFASHLLLGNYDIRTIQEMLGHSDVRTTMIYLQTVPARTRRDRRSPLDLPDEAMSLAEGGEK